MSTYYDFMVEAKYEGKWYNIDFHTKDIDGKLRHQYLATISRSFIGLLEDRVNGAWAISFDDLAESTQQLLLASTFEGREDSLRLERFYVAGNLDDFERLLNGPYQMEYYVTRNQIAAYEEQKIDEIYEYLTAHELLELPQAARSEYVLYRWNDTRVWSRIMSLYQYQVMSKKLTYDITKLCVCLISICFKSGQK